MHALIKGVSGHTEYIAVAVLGLGRVCHSLPSHSTGLPGENCSLPWGEV